MYGALQIELARPESELGNRLGRSVQGAQNNIMSQHNESYCSSSLNMAKLVRKFIKINVKKNGDESSNFVGGKFGFHDLL